MKLATCHTADIDDQGTPCPNMGLQFLWDDQAAQQAAEAALADMPEGTVMAPPAIWCGGCGHKITDVIDPPAEHADSTPDTFVGDTGEAPPAPDPALLGALVDQLTEQTADQTGQTADQAEQPDTSA